MTLKNIITISFRYFSNTSVNYSTYHQSKFLAKLVYGTRKKKIWYESNAKINEKLPIIASIKKGPGSKKRQDVLNKLFERHITEMLSSGGILSDAISGCGVHISKIKITQDHTILNVHWISNEKDFAKVEQTFNDYKKYLRHELSQLNLIGHVPRIEFVEIEKMLTGLKEVIEKDKEVESTLESIQENEIGSNMAGALPGSHIDDKNISKNIEVEEEEPLPPMLANVYNLNRQIIIAKIQSSLKKSRAHQFGHKSESEINDKNNKNTSAFILPAQVINFKSYLRKKAIMKKKAKKIQEEIYLEKNIDSQYEEELTDGFRDTFK